MGCYWITEPEITDGLLINKIHYWTWNYQREKTNDHYYFITKVQRVLLNY
jgi:hypothetical protein